MLNTIRPLSEELQKAAIEQLFEVPERIPADLEALKTWIQQQPHLRARTDDQFLVAFLRGCKYSLEKAKAKLDKYYALRTKFPEMLRVTDVDDPKFREIVKLGTVLYLPKPLPNGQCIGVMRNGTYSPDLHKLDDVFRVSNAVNDIILMENDNAVVNGVVYISDMANTTASHMFQMTPWQMNRFMTYSQEGLPIRPKAYHFVNTISAFQMVFNMVKPMMAEKQQQRLHVHGHNMESLYEVIPKEYLPEDYGGENGNFTDLAKEWDRKFDQYREHFKEEANYGTDESLRPGRSIDFDNIFGTDGCFRKLEVD